MNTRSVKLLSPRAGHRFDDKGRLAGEFVQNTGDVVEMPADEAQRYIDRGLAAPVNDNKKG